MQEWRNDECSVRHSDGFKTNKTHSDMFRGQLDQWDNMQKVSATHNLDSEYWLNYAFVTVGDSHPVNRIFFIAHPYIFFFIWQSGSLSLIYHLTTTSNI